MLINYFDQLYKIIIIISTLKVIFSYSIKIKICLIVSLLKNEIFKFCNGEIVKYNEELIFVLAKRETEIYIHEKEYKVIDFN